MTSALAMLAERGSWAVAAVWLFIAVWVVLMAARLLSRGSGDRR
jgi:hypothetical protein